MSDEGLVGQTGDDLGSDEATPSQEELQVGLPVDWDDLKAEVLCRDDARCVVCGAEADERQLYVLYRRPPNRLSRVPPSVSSGNASGEGETEIEVPGFGVENMGTVCEVHAECDEMDARTVVVPEEARAAKEATLEDVTEEESGFVHNAEVTDNLGSEVEFPGREGTEASSEGDGPGSRFGMADEFSSAMDAVPGSSEEPDEPYIVPEDAEEGGEYDLEADDQVEREVMTDADASAERERVGGSGESHSEPSADPSGADVDGEDEPGLVRSRQQRSFGLHLPFAGRAFRMLRAVVWVAVSVTVSSGVGAAVLGGSAEAGASVVLDIAGGFVGAASMVVSSPVLVFGAIAFGYAIHLRYRDGVYSEWPMIRESPSPGVAGRRLVVGAGLTLLLGIGVTVFGELLALGTSVDGGSAPVSVTGVVLSVVYAVGVGVTMKLMSDTVVADRKAGSGSRASAWELPVRVGGVLGVAVAVTGTLMPMALIGSAIPVALAGPVSVASVVLAPAVALGYAVRRRAWPTTQGVPVEMDTSV